MRFARFRSRPHTSAQLTLVVALMTMIGPFTIDTYLPSFLSIEAEFAIGRHLLLQSLSLYMASFAVSTLFVGALSDRFGRLPVILVSLGCYLVASLAAALSPDYATFLFSRILQGIFAAGGMVAGRAIIRDAFPPGDAQRAMSRVMLLFGLAPAIAPVIGGWLHDALGWRSVFYFLALYSALVVALTVLMISETLPGEHRQSLHPRKVMQVYLRTLTNRRFLFLTLIVSSYFSGMFLYISGAPTVIFDFLKLGTNDFGYLFIPLVGGMMCGAWLSGRVAHAWSSRRTAGLALVMMLLGSLLNLAQAVLSPGLVFTTIAPLMLYTFGIGLAMPVMTILALDCFPLNRGSASAMQGFMQLLGTTSTAAVLVPLVGQSPAQMAACQLALIVFALLLWWRLPAGEACAERGAG